MSISVKWPAVRLLGPRVTEDQALEYIRRTDNALIGHAMCNDRRFEDDLNWLLFGGKDWTGEDGKVNYSAQYDFMNRFEEAFGHVSLNHLGSQWVASSYIGGPNGPVHPDGRVELSRNFGKWPSEEGIEADLTKIAGEFPWLTFDLSVWGDQDETTDGLPTNTWHLEGGWWEAVEPKIVDTGYSSETMMANFISQLSGGRRRETTWSVYDIGALWGEQIQKAREAASVEQAG